jgi:8-oxo-dGTP pyrophosphatase MutT (NUDIX family)
MPYDEYAASLNRKRTSAGVLFHTEDARVLLVETTYKQHWDIPGGTVDDEETPWSTAIREVREETGIIRPLGRLLVIDHVPTDGVMPEGLMFVFDGGTVTDSEIDSIASTDPEIRTVSLRSLAEARRYVSAALHSRITAATDAIRSGRLWLCNSGTPTIDAGTTP